MDSERFGAGNGPEYANKPQDIGLDAKKELAKILDRGYEEILSTDSFEAAGQALASITELRQFRAEAAASVAPGVYKIAEYFSAVNAVAEPAANRRELAAMVADSLTPEAGALSPRAADFYLGLLAKVSGQQYEAKFEATKTKIAELASSGDLSLLVDGQVSLSAKLDRLQKRLEPFLRGLKALDAREGYYEKDKKAAADIPAPLPPAKDRSRPTIDRRERLREGEPARVFWSINPGFGGYFREQALDSWDAQNSEWVQSSYEYKTFRPAWPNDASEKILITAAAPANQWTRLPQSDLLELVSVTSGGKAVDVRQDQHGDFIFLISGQGGGLNTVTATFQKRAEPLKRAQSQKPSTPTMPAKFSPETETELNRVNQNKKGNKVKSMALAGFVMKTQHYNSEDEKYNDVYRNDPEGFFASIDRHKQSDCDVANSYFAALCARLNIPVRHVIGHMVKGRTDEGVSQMHSGSGSGWSEIWDEGAGEWLRVDATPPGDPQKQEDQKSGRSVDGDYGSQEAIGPTDEQLKDLQAKLENLAEQLSYTAEERNLAEAGGVPLKEARAINKEILEAESVRLPSGQLVIDVLAKLFNLIVESRKAGQIQDLGPIRKREGGEGIEDFVTHYIGTESGEADPASRVVEREVIKERGVYGGMDVYLVGDKSGSMNQTVDGQEKWRLQRRAGYTVLGSLHRFERGLERAKSMLEDPLSIRTKMISFRGSGPGEIDEDKPLSNTFSPMDKVRLWKSLGKKGSGNGDVAALTLIRDEIKKEILEDEAKTKKKDNRLRVIFACSDGEPDSAEGVRQLVNELAEMRVVVVGLGLTKTAAKVPVIFNTANSRGELVEDLQDLPKVVAKNIILEAIKLFPARAKAQAAEEIKRILGKF